MGCLPISGGCERFWIEPFVGHINSVEEKRYRHQKCLDRVDRNEPQPEALYVDDETKDRLVIERKSFVWPDHYAERHRNDHFVAGVLMEALKDVTSDGPYGILLKPNAVGSRAELHEFALGVARIVSDYVEKARWGYVLSGGRGARRWWFYREDAVETIYPFRDPDDAAPTGLACYWSLDDVFNLPIDEATIKEMERILQSTTRKFHRYMSDRRVLLLEGFGDVQYQSSDWWKRLLGKVKRPVEVSEIWLSTCYRVSDHELDWDFERLHP